MEGKYIEKYIPVKNAYCLDYIIIIYLESEGTTLIDVDY